MRLLSRLLIAIIVCLITIVLPSMSAQAECVPWEIELFPESAAPGTEVTVYGHGFDAGRPIDLYYDEVLVSEGTETDSGGEFYITFVVPEDCTGHYWVLARVGSSLGIVEADRQFAVKPGLTVSPEKGPIGTNVTVNGWGFTQNEQGIELQYYANGGYETIETNIKANARGSWERSFQVPSSTRGEHKIDAQGPESHLYEVEDAIFRVTSEISIDKSSGIVGDTITMSGSEFATYERGIMILFDDQAVVTDIEANSEGKWQASFDVPELPAGEYSITAEGELTTKEDLGELSFEIKPEFILSPDHGHVGTDLTVTGRGFPAYQDVIILYDDNQVATTETDDEGTFEVSFSVPESKHGEHVVRAKLAGGTNNTADLEVNASATFTMESDPPPVPTLISPVDGVRLGFLSEVAPTFEWSEVSDDSGIAYYQLQIATSADFNASSIILTVTDLTETSYTLKETEALPLGSYYWIVQAVDGAENESGWSANHSLRVGFLPLWGFIGIIIAAVIILVIIIRTIVVRRSIYYDGW
jgi:hypothetical protein